MSSKEIYIPEITCPKCKRYPAMSVKTGNMFYSHICHEDCEMLFFTLAVCPHCDKPDKTLLLTKPRYNELIKCANCSGQFYLFVCPIETCQAFFYKTKNGYIPGQNVDCQSCKTCFRHVVCSCGCEVSLNKDTLIIEGQGEYTCKICKKPIVYTSCKGCSTLSYHTDSLELGDKIKCPGCKFVRQYMPCPGCGKTTNCTKFNFSQPYKCDYCSISFEYSSCPQCFSCNYFFSDKVIGPERKCSNPKCKALYCALSCQKCSNPVFLEDYDVSQGREEDCPQCKNQLKFYYCKSCQTFNKNDSKCLNPRCPPPKAIMSHSKLHKQVTKKESQKQNQAKNKLNQNYEEKSCKLCCIQESCMVNNKCRHVMMCEDCFINYKRTKRITTNIAQCPVCKQIGLFTKTIEYIYQ